MEVRGYYDSKKNMKIWKNLFGKGDRIHSDVIDVNGEKLTDVVDRKVEVITQGRGPGIVIDVVLESYSIYLLVVGRDQGLYLISTYGNESFISTILDMSGGKSITTDGLNLVVNFSTRNRTYTLSKLNTL